MEYPVLVWQHQRYLVDPDSGLVLREGKPDLSTSLEFMDRLRRAAAPGNAPATRLPAVQAILDLNAITGRVTDIEAINSLVRQLRALKRQLHEALPGPRSGPSAGSPDRPSERPRRRARRRA